MFKEFLQSTKLKELMTAPVITVKEDDEFHKVEDKFSTHDIRHLPVINSAHQVIGLITQRHLYKIHSPRRLEDGTWFYDKDMLDSFILKNVMVEDPYLLKPDNTIGEAMKAIVEFKFGCIPIVDDYSRPVGILTRDDIIKFFLKQK